ncbi:hypothetical protein CR956_01255 [Candidatus Saccharibacteria bacterium]|nr:MAG: hypothetical protein CR956_01255 [Candidatus Saccharibacteria bacterium]
MRAVVIYKERSDHAREVDDYMRDYTRQTGKRLEVIDPDSRDGADFCRVYDVVEYPTILALSDDGQVLKQWRGRPLPVIGQVGYYG